MEYLNNLQNSPLISVLIPVHNSERFLNKCLSSIINQTYTNIEIICNDDASTDKSLIMLKSFAKQDKRIKIIQNKTNFGENKTRKNLINKINGEYFIFIDSDDYIEKNFIQKMYETIITDRSDLVECNVNIIKIGNRKTDFTVKKFGVFTANQYINFYKAVLWNKLFKTDIVRKNKINFPTDKSITCGFDKFFNFEYITLSNKVSVIKNKLYNYVIHNSSTLSTMREDQILSDFYSLNSCYDFLQNKDLFVKFNMQYFKLMNKFKSKLLKSDVFYNVALEQINILNKKIYRDHKYIYFLFLLFGYIKNMFSIQSSLDGRYKIISLFNLKFAILKK